jgi:hypothetical protein
LQVHYANAGREFFKNRIGKVGPHALADVDDDAHIFLKPSRLIGPRERFDWENVGLEGKRGRHYEFVEQIAGGAVERASRFGISAVVAVRNEPVVGQNSEADIAFRAVLLGRGRRCRPSGGFDEPFNRAPEAPDYLRNLHS